MPFAKGGTVRSGWCALLFIAIYVALSTLSEMLLSRFVQLETHGPLSAGHLFAEESCDLFAVLSTFGVPIHHAEVARERPSLPGLDRPLCCESSEKTRARNACRSPGANRCKVQGLWISNPLDSTYLQMMLKTGRGEEGKRTRENKKAVTLVML
jgi:hypothetical protein